MRGLAKKMLLAIRSIAIVTIGGLALAVPHAWAQDDVPAATDSGAAAESDPADLFDMSKGGNAHKLVSIGDKAALAEVRSEHFPDAFDLLAHA